MGRDINKLRDALLEIKSECQSHGNSCLSCPLEVDDYTCGVTGIKMIGDYDYRKKPQYWKIPSIKLMEKVEYKE